MNNTIQCPAHCELEGDRAEMRSRSPSLDHAVPRVSIVVPVYNGERFLDEAIKSIREQTFTRFELLIVDDGSADLSGDIARRHAAQDNRVRILRLEHVGIANALNAGIMAARADCIARMDADDIAAPEWLDRLLTFAAEQRDITVLGAQAWLMNVDGQVVGRSQRGPITRSDFHKEREVGAIHLFHNTVIFPKAEAIRLGGYRSDYEPAEDFDLWSRFADNHLILATEEPLVYYRIHDNATSTRRLKVQFESVRRAQINTVRRRRREPELSLYEFRAFERERPVLERLRSHLRVRSQLSYRCGGSLLAEGKPLGLYYIALSGLLFPPVPLKRLYAQKIVQTAVSNILTKREMADPTSESTFGSANRRPGGTKSHCRSKFHNRAWNNLKARRLGESREDR